MFSFCIEICILEKYIVIFSDNRKILLTKKFINKNVINKMFINKNVINKMFIMNKKFIDY